MKRLASAIAAAVDASAIVCSALVTGLMVFLVIARYMLGLSIVGLHELILLFAVALYMSGALIASRRREHITVDWLAQRIIQPRAKALHALVVAVITLIVTLFFIVWTYFMFAWGLQRPQTTQGLGIPLWIPQLAILAAALGCTAYAIRDIVDAIGRLRSA